MKDVDRKIDRLLDIARSNVVVAGGDISMEALKKMPLGDFFNICAHNNIKVDFYFERPWEREK